MPYKDWIIITHAGKPHMDETLAVAMLLSRDAQQPTGNRYQLQRVQHKNVDAYKGTANGIWVDVGGKHDMSGKFFDHHHDPELRSSMSLVREWVETDPNFLGKVAPETKVEAYLDYLDRHGPVAAAKLGICSEDEIALIFECSQLITGLIDYMWTDGKFKSERLYEWSPYNVIAGALNTQGWSITVDTLWKMVTALRASYPVAMGKVDEKIADDKKKYEEDLSNMMVTISNTGERILGVIPADLDNCTYIGTDAANVAFMLRKSSRDDNVTHLIANTDTGHNVNAIKECVSESDIQFIHANGFLMVINLPLTSDLKSAVQDKIAETMGISAARVPDADNPHKSAWLYKLPAGMGKGGCA